MEALKRHHWPGNIRELQNVLERAVITTRGTVLDLRTAGVMTAKMTPTTVLPSHKTLFDARRAHIISTLRKTNWVVSGPHGAAAELGLPRTTLTAMMRRLGIDRETLRQQAGHPQHPFMTMPPQGPHQSWSQEPAQT
jgi:transcriptional regulator of acetoin/glycerol metabolism